MKDRILVRLSTDSIEERGAINEASGARFVQSREFEKAFAVFMISAREGYAPCQNSVGYAYDHGEGVKQNQSEAVRWYKMAADQNHPEAQFNLAQSYFQGTGVESNYSEGLKYLIKAANNGHVIALHNLGNEYDAEGNAEQAFTCYKKAAEAGWAESQHNLAVCYLNGEGTDCDEVEALRWFKAAAQNGIKEASDLLKSHGLL